MTRDGGDHPNKAGLPKFHRGLPAEGEN